MIKDCLLSVLSIDYCLCVGGINSYEADPSQAGDSLRGCMDSTTKHVPKDEQQKAPLYLGATAGMRLLQYESLLILTCYHINHYVRPKQMSDSMLEIKNICCNYFMTAIMAGCKVISSVHPALCLSICVSIHKLFLFDVTLPLTLLCDATVSQLT